VVFSANLVRFDAVQMRGANCGGAHRVFSICSSLLVVREGWCCVVAADAEAWWWPEEVLQVRGCWCTVVQAKVAHGDSRKRRSVKMKVLLFWLLLSHRERRWWFKSGSQVVIVRYCSGNGDDGTVVLFPACRAAVKMENNGGGCHG